MHALIVIFYLFKSNSLPNVNYVSMHSQYSYSVQQNKPLTIHENKIVYFRPHLRTCHTLSIHRQYSSSTLPPALLAIVHSHCVCPLCHAITPPSQSFLHSDMDPDAISLSVGSVMLALNAVW